jgi:hypothetical protein
MHPNLERVRAAAVKRLLLLPHTIRQMARPERMISTTEIEQVVMLGEIIVGAKHLVANP